MLPGFGDLRKIESEQGYEVPKSNFKQWQASTALKRALDRTRRLREAEQAKQTAIAKTAALSEAVKPSPLSEETQKALAEALRRGAQLVRSVRSGVVDPLVQRYQNADPRLRRAVETVVSPAKTALSPIGKAVGFVLKQTSRPWSGIKTAVHGEGFLKGFLHPEQAPQYIISPESWTAAGLTPEDRRRMSAALEFFGGVVTDPTTYLGIGVVGKGAKGVEAAIKTGEKIQQLESASQRAARLLQAAREATTTGKGIKGADKIARKIDDVAKRWQKAADLQNKFKNLPADTTIKQRSKLASSVLRARSGAKQAEAELADMIRKQIENIPHKGVARLETARLGTMLPKSGAVTERLQGYKDVVEALRKRASTPTGKEALAPLLKQRVPQLLSNISRKQRELSNLGKYYLKLGPVPVVSVQPLIRGGRVLGSTLAGVPGIAHLRNILVSTFKPTSARHLGDMSPAELRRTSAMLRELHSRMRRAGELGILAGEKASTEGGLLNVPRKARETASLFREAIGKGLGDLYRQRDVALDKRDFKKYLDVQLKIKQAESVNARDFLDKLDPELRSQVLEADRLYRASMDQITHELVNTFGDGFERRLLKNYVTHITQADPQKVEQFLDKWSASVPTIGGGMAPSITTPLGKAYFTRRRLVPTIEELDKAGLKPVKDVNLLQAAYRTAAVKMLEQKKITDWLEREGFIVRNTVPGGWVPNVSGRGKVIDWLPETAGIHPEVARAFSSLQPLIEGNHQEIKALLKAWDAATSLFKVQATSIRPSFHIVNQMGNNILLRMAGISYPEQARKYPQALKILLSGKPEDRKLVNLFREHGLEGQGMFSDAAHAPQQVIKHLENYLQRATRGKIGKIGAIVWPKHGIPGVSLGQYAGEMVDSVARMVGFLHFLEKGLSPQEAASLVKRYLFDYSMLTPTERFVRRFFIPFYAWSRYSIPRSILGLVEQPGAYTGFYRLQQQLASANEIDLNDLPTWLQASVLALGKTPDGVVFYLNAQPPWAQLFGWATSDELTGEPQVGRDIAQSLHPALSALFNLTSGVEPVTGKKIVESPLEPHPTLKKLGAALSKFFPLTQEFEKLYPGEKATTVGRLVQGWPGYITSFVSTYDVPLSKANELKRASGVIDEAVRMKKEEGYLVPETEKVQEQVKRYDAGERAKKILSDPIRVLLITTILGAENVSKDPTSVLDFVMNNGDLFTGSGKDVLQKLQKLYNEDNARFLETYLGRTPSLRDFVAHRKLLEDPQRKAVPPLERKAERVFRNMRDIAESTAPSGVSRSAFSTDDPIIKAARIVGVDDSWIPYIRWLVKRESGGNPRAVGTIPVGRERAIGLLQTLPSTFRSYALPGYGDIYNPLHNAIAAMRYIKARYGHPSRIPNIGNWSAFRGY